MKKPTPRDCAFTAWMCAPMPVHRFNVTWFGTDRGGCATHKSQRVAVPGRAEIMSRYKIRQKG